MAKEVQPIDMVTDVYIPAVIIAALFVINGIVLFFIFKKRKDIDYNDISDEVQAPSVSHQQQHNVASVEAGHPIELETL